MRRILGAGVAAAGLLACLTAAAQNTTTVVTPDQTTTVTDTTAGTMAETYPTTGWDPSLLLWTGGGLALGGVVLKGVLRRREA